MKSIRPWLAYAVLVPLCALVSLLVARATVKQSIPPEILTPVHRLAAGGVDPYAFYANQRAAGHFYITDPSLSGCSGGAVGNGSHDDLPCFTAAGTLAAAAGGVIDVPNPSTCWGISAMYTPPPGVWMRGKAGEKGQSIICALSSMRALVALHAPSVVLAVDPSPFRDITLDGKNLAIDGLLLDSAWTSRVFAPYVTNVRRDGIHAVGHRLPLIISAVTPGAGGVAGVTVTQYDPGYQALGNTAGHTFTVIATIVGGGALGTATYSATVDGVSATFTQTVTALSNMATASVGTFLADSGLQWSFPVHTYAPGETYTITAQNQTEDSGSGAANNADVKIYDPWIDTFGHVENSGNVTVSAGGNIGVGSGTTWLTGAATGQQARPGDTIQISGAGSYPIGSVLDDTHFILPKGETFSASATNAAYTLNVGYAIYWDDSGDQARSIVRGGFLTNGPNGERIVGGIDGSQVIADDVRFDTITGIDVLYGSGLLNSMSGTIDNVEFKHQGSNLLVYVQANNYLNLYEPHQTFQPATDIKGSGVARITLSGSDMTYGSMFGGANTMVPISSLLLSPTNGTTLAFTSAGQQIPAPDPYGPSPTNTSYVVLQTSSDFVLTSAPTIAAPTANGQVLIVANSSSSSGILTLQDRTVLGGSGMVLEGPEVVLFPGDRLWFFAVGGSPFGAIWEQAGTVQRAYVGKNFKASSDGKPSGYVETTNGTATSIQVWDLTFGPTNGFMVKCDVSARDMGTGDLGFWDDVQIAVDGVGNLLGGKSIAHARGSNAGAPASTMTDPDYSVAGGQLLLKVQGTAAHTIKWFDQCTMTSVVNF